MATVEQELALRAVLPGKSKKTAHLTGVGDASQDLQADWLRYLTKEKNLAPNTLKLYGTTVEKAAQELGPLENLTVEPIRAWLHSKTCAPGTTSNRISALTSFYKYLVRVDVRADNPCDKLDRPKQEKGLPRPIRDIPMALDTLDAADQRANDKGVIPRRVGETRDMAVFLIETGLRIHEAVALVLPVPCPRELQVKGKGRKEARLPLTERAREAWDRLGGQWGTGRDGKPIGARATQRRFERADFSPHQCRHTCGTLMGGAGRDLGDIQHMLRHASPATTLVYTEWNTDRVRAAREGIDY